MLKIKSSTLPFIRLTRLLGGGSVLLRSRNSLDVFKLPRPPESRVQSPEGCGGGGKQRSGKVPPQTRSKRALLETGQQEYKKSTPTASKG